ncbi:hypothetical protein TNCV_1116141 [Trichonephila clavipes]|nr:hypothetical protein TNCV_1116141 [Trichonephila clavipes]
MNLLMSTCSTAASISETRTPIPTSIGVSPSIVSRDQSSSSATATSQDIKENLGRHAKLYRKLFGCRRKQPQLTYFPRIRFLRIPPHAEVGVMWRDLHGNRAAEGLKYYYGGGC